LRGLVSFDKKATDFHLDIDALDYSKPRKEIYKQVALIAHREITPARACRYPSALAYAELLGAPTFSSLFLFGSTYNYDAALPSWTPNWTANKSQTLHKSLSTKTSPERDTSAIRLQTQTLASVEETFCNSTDEPLTIRFRGLLVSKVLKLHQKHQSLALTELLYIFDRDDVLWKSLFDIICATGGQPLRTAFIRSDKSRKQELQRSPEKEGQTCESSSAGLRMSMERYHGHETFDSHDVDFRIQPSAS
jgi:hypothetical protein